jgi:peptidoglycan hydrolase-like protein with peptidoglycan-binding domain
MHGTDVEVLQKALAEAGFNPGIADGDFGPATRLAVEELQHKAHLVVDGVVGDHTSGALGGILDKALFDGPLVDDEPEPVGQSDHTADPSWAGFAHAVADSYVHSARQLEDAIDHDDDGSLVDEAISGAIRDIPFVGPTVGAIGDEMGDFVTDALGTRHTGIFSRHGTWSPNTADDDYRDGTFAGAGHHLNQNTDLNDVISAEDIIETAVMVGGLAAMGPAAPNIVVYSGASAAVGGPTYPEIVDEVQDWTRAQDDHHVTQSHANGHDHDYDSSP